MRDIITLAVELIGRGASSVDIVEWGITLSTRGPGSTEYVVAPIDEAVGFAGAVAHPVLPGDPPSDFERALAGGGITDPLPPAEVGVNDDQRNETAERGPAPGDGGG